MALEFLFLATLARPFLKFCLNNMIIPNFIIPDLRTDHAGETGAVFIYKGILLISKDREIIATALYDLVFFLCIPRFIAYD